MLASFDAVIRQTLYDISHLVDDTFREAVLERGGLERDRVIILQLISKALHKFCNKRVVVLIDEYDSPMHSAIEHGYAQEVLFPLSSIHIPHVTLG